MFNPAEFEVIESVEAKDGSKVEIVQYKELKGSADIRTSESLYFANQSGMRLKMVRIQLANSQVRVEPGSLYFMKGDLEMKASTGGGILRGLARAVDFR